MMKKRNLLCLVLAVILALSLVACSTGNNEANKPNNSETPVHSNVSGSPSPTSPSPTAGVDIQTELSGIVERLGFEGGNIGAGGLLCGGEDGHIYYRSESDGWKLYKAKPDGTEKTKLSDRIPNSINVLDGWVYFSDFSDDFSLYKIRTDGTGETKLVDGYCQNLFVAESGLYFDMRDSNNQSNIYRADLDGGNMTLLFPEATLMYYHRNKIYLGATQLGVYDIAAKTETMLADTTVHNVTVDDTGIYYWAVDKGEFRCMNLDGSNDRVILSGGNFFNYSDGNLYYMGFGENINGSCHVMNKLNIATDETALLIEELNEYFNAHGELVGVTFKQFQEQPETIDPELIKANEQGEIFIGYNESVGYIYVFKGQLYMRCLLRDSLIQNGKLDCIARLDGSVKIWD